MMGIGGGAPAREPGKWRCENPGTSEEYERRALAEIEARTVSGEGRAP